jgi:hypothetical protein
MNILIRLMYGVAFTTMLSSWIYISYLKSEISTLEENNSTLYSSVQEQQKVIERQIKDIGAIQRAKENQLSIIKNQQLEILELDKKFSITAQGESRDLGKITRAKPVLIERIVNSASRDAMRCFEIATGDALKNDDGNRECPNLIESQK